MPTDESLSTTVEPPSSSLTHSPPHPSFWSKLKSIFSGNDQNTESLQSDIEDALAEGRIEEDVRDMLDGVLEVAELQARDVMIPRSQMIVIERDTPIKTIIEMVIENGHSRFPVIGEDKDEVVGILMAKDLLRAASDMMSNASNFDIRECLRNPVFIPESKRLNSLLSDFRTSRNHMAIVVDEYGGVAGLVTIEDVLERIVGDIDDEYDTETDINILKEGDNLFAVRALTRIEDFNEYFEVELSDEEYDTIGGLVVSQLGRMPIQGDNLSFAGFDFNVYRVDQRRIHTLKVKRSMTS